MNLLILRPGALGDTLMLVPSLARLGSGVSVTVVGRRPGLDFIQEHLCLAVDMETAGWHRLFLERPPANGTLPVPEPDRVVAFFSDPDGTIRRNLKAYFPNAAVRLFPSLPPPETDIHAAQHIARCLQQAGLPIDPEEVLQSALSAPVLKIPVAPSSKARILLHPGSGDLGKNHPPQFWRTLMERIQEQFDNRGLEIDLLMGPAEEALIPFFAQHPLSASARRHICPGKEELLLLLAKASLCLGHDSGITHLAAMLGTPTLALFRTTDPLQWRPLGPRVRILARKAPTSRLMDQILKQITELLPSEPGSHH